MSRKYTAALCIDAESFILKLADGVEFIAQFDFEVEAEFTYSPGEPEVISGRWEDSSDGSDDELHFISIKPLKRVDLIDGNTWDVEAPGIGVYISAGCNILDRFTAHQIEAMEDEILQRKRLSGDFD
jgi:hypothetical protein